ncbi:MAG: hypothetical protein WA085_12670 [Sphingobium sp.]
MAAGNKPIAMRFPRGVDQVSAETDLPGGTARRIVNLDVHDGGISKNGVAFGGRLAQRSAVKLAIAGVRTHSLWSCEYATLYVAAGNLMIVDTGMSASVLRAGVGEAEMFYGEVNGTIYYSNGSLTGSVTAGVDGVWGLPVPPAPNASAMTSGGLDAGTYMVALTYKDATGRESGSSPASIVQVAAGGGIALSGMAAAYVARVYVTPANGEALYWAHDLPIGAATSYIGTHSPGKLLATQHMMPMEPCTLLEYYNGRVYGVVGNALVATQAMNYDLTRPTTDYVLMPSELTMNKAVSGGLYLGSEHGVTFMAGGDIGAFAPSLVDGLAPIPGSAMKIDGVLFGMPGDGVVWLTRRGWVFGGASGQTKRLTESQMALPKYDRAAGLYREHDGMRQLMTFVKGGGEAAGASDSYEVEIVRNGHLI